MWKHIRKFGRDCKGAVTVFVTLMLVPAVLVSGSGVDIARLYVARSELQDANQLAANSALASYDALLQDLYGLYGIMQSDAELASMMEEYIKIAIFGENWKDRTLGNLSHFYGEASSLTVQASPADGKNLENPEVLRRQIEEYAKFRAPYVIANEILDRLDVFEKVKEDAAVIEDKMAIDDKIEEIDKVYEKLYRCIQNVNNAKNVESGAVQSVNTFIDRIESTIDNLYNVRTDDYTPAAQDENNDLAGDYLNKYQGLFDNLNHQVSGGTIYEGYILGGENILGIYQNGDFTTSYYTDGVQKTIDEKGKELNRFISNATFEDDSLEELLDLAEQADKKRAELSKLVDDLEARLNSGKCSEELKRGLTKTTTSNGKTYIETYRSMLNYDISAMAQAMKDHDEPQLNATIDMIKNEVGYGNLSLGTDSFFSFDTIGRLNENQDGYEIDLILQNTERSKNGQSLLYDRLAHLDGITPPKYEVPGTYELFQSSVFDDTKNREFYELLQSMYGGADNSTKKSEITKGIEKVAGQIQDQFTGILEFDPLGAWNYTRGSDSSGETNSTSFGTGDSWSGSGAVKEQTKDALNDNLLSSIAQAGNTAANKLLLLTYDSEMFSCYATNDGYSGTREQEAEEPTEENMAGIPLGIKVNYYFQSELEYLYNGNLTDAKANLEAVTGMIFLIRFVMDYTISFTIPKVNDTVKMVESSLSFLGPGAIVIGELVRLVMSLGEAVTDVSRLKNGCQVVLGKTDDTWRFSLDGLLDQIADGIVGELTAGSFGDDEDNDDTGLVYKDYMRMFLLLVDGDVLAQRTANLIELNVTNYRDGIGNNSDRSAREQAMSSAELFDMRKAITDFSVTTAVNMKMLFLSSPIAQSGYVNGVVPPKTKELVVTDYRGY